MSSLTSRKDVVPYENSMLTKVLADSLGTAILHLECVKIFWHFVVIRIGASRSSYSENRMNKFFFVFECENDLLKGRELHGERKYII